MRWFPAVALVVAAFASEGVRLQVPYVPQEQNGCGAAVVAMILQYWRGPAAAVDAAAIHRQLYTPEARGAYASSIESYLRRHGFRAFAFRGEWRDLEDHLQKGRPLLVALETGRQDLHYVVLTGIDPANKLVLKHDPAVRQYVKQHRAEFERQWKGARNWTLLAVPDSSR